MTTPNSSSPFGRPGAAADDDTFEADLPEGDSNFVIDADQVIGRLIDIEKATSDAGNAMWVWQFAVNEGPHAGFELRTYTALTPAAMWKVREVCVALGLGEAGQPMKFKKADAKNRLCVLNLEVQEYRGIKRSSITSVEPHPSGAGTKATVKGTGPAKPSTPTQARGPASGGSSGPAKPGQPQRPAAPKPAAAKPAAPPPADPPEDEEVPPEDEVPFEKEEE